MEKHNILPVAYAPRSPSAFPTTKIKTIVTFLVGCCLLATWLLNCYFPLRSFGDDETSFEIGESPRCETRAPSPTPTPAGVLDVFQVSQPVLTPPDAKVRTSLSGGQVESVSVASIGSRNHCEVKLMVHAFAFSYGVPYVGNYTPPNCEFNRVTWNFTVTTRGRQFDRLGLAYFGDTEIWRTSTAEPTINGIEWTYIKEMTEYLYFWKAPQTFIFDLGNLVDDTYTGVFNTVLTASFFTSQDIVEPADLIIPVSARKGSSNSPSVFMLPADTATNTFKIPRNANRAVFSVSACGQATEEFWWGNVLQSNVDTFVPVDGTLYGYSPFREVQVLIDSQLAGVHWPFPVIFTGGVVPGLWKPIVGIDAFDLREHEIDITPWLPLLSDGEEHKFEIQVVGLIDDGNDGASLTDRVGASWYVTGKVFLWLDQDPSAITTGPAPTLHLPAPSINVSQKLKQDAVGANETLEYTTNVQRHLAISSFVHTQKGTYLSTWTQSLSVTIYGLYTAFGATQQSNHTTTGVDESSNLVSYRSAYSFPLYSVTTYLADPTSGNFTIDATIIHGLDLAVSGTPVSSTGLEPFAHLPQAESLMTAFSGSSLKTIQNGSAHFFGSPSAGLSSGYGKTGQMFTFSGTHIGGDGVDTELYFRNVQAENLTVVRDEERVVGVPVGGLEEAQATQQQVFMGPLVRSPRASLGRGYGMAKVLLVQGA